MNFKCLHSFAQEHLHGPTGLGSTRQKRSGVECRKLLIFFGAGKHYTHARVLAPSLKNGGISSIVGVGVGVMFSCNVFVGINLFRTKLV